MGLLDELFGNKSMNLMPSQASVNQPMNILPPIAQAGRSVEPSFGDHLTAGAQSFANSGKLLPALVNGITGLATGQRQDPAGKTQQALNMTGQALIQKGVDPNVVQAAIGNPELMRTLITQTFGKPQVQ